MLTDMPVRLVRRHKPLLRRSVVLFGIRWRCMRLAMEHRFFGFSGKGVIIAKAYLQKKGTTTEKCASSAESLQSVALLSAVIPQTVGRCCRCSLSFVKDRQMRQLLLTAIIAFATKRRDSENKNAILAFGTSIHQSKSGKDTNEIDRLLLKNVANPL